MEGDVCEFTVISLSSAPGGVTRLRVQAAFHAPGPACKIARPPEVSHMERIESPPPLPPRPAEGHKGMFGRVLVVGGNDGMIGAPVLAGTSALRTGAGLVQIAVPRSILHACLSITPELIGLGLGKASGKDELLKAGELADAIVIGPGLGRTPEAEGRLVRLVRLDKPMVIDADALNILAGMKKWPSFFKARAVLTPHPGEMAR